LSKIFFGRRNKSVYGVRASAYAYDTVQAAKVRYHTRTGGYMINLFVMTGGIQLPR